MTLVALPGVFYTIRWNYYLYLWINFIVLKEKPYAFNLASNKLWLSVSNALDKSNNIVPTFLPLSTAYLYRKASVHCTNTLTFFKKLMVVLSHFWPIAEGTTLLTRCFSLHFISMFDLKVPEILATKQLFFYHVIPNLMIWIKLIFLSCT